MTTALVAGLVHDFHAPAVVGRWFRPRPALPGALLAVGFVCTLAHSLAGGARDSGDSRD